jgi:hypothetical protein
MWLFDRGSSLKGDRRAAGGHGTGSRVTVPRRVLVLGLVFVSVAGSVGAQPARESAAVARRVYSPLTIDPNAPEPPPPTEERTDFRRFADLLRQLEEIETAGVVAPPPDQVLAFDAGPPEQATAPSFPGAGFNGLTPADTTLGKSPNRVLQAVNSQIRLYANDGALLASKSLAAFLGTDNFPRPPFDPRILFDRIGPNQRFYVVATEQDPPQPDGRPPQSLLFLSVSRSPDPPSLDPAHWCTYGLWSGSDLSDNGFATFADFPMLGVGADTVVVSANYRRNTVADPAFTYAILQAFDKVALSQNTTSCPTAMGTIYRPAASPNDQSQMFLQPVHHGTAPSSFPGASNPLYLVSARPQNSDVTEYRLWRLRNNSLGASSANLQQILVPAQPYTLPPFALQPGTTTRVVTNDCRVAAAAGLGDTIWFVHTVRCNVGGGADESCFRVVQVGIGQSSGSPTAAVQLERTVGGVANSFFYMPGLAVTASQRVVVPFLTSSSSQRQSLAWTAKSPSQSAFQASQVLAGGLCNLPPIDRDRADYQRVGDYVAASVEPSSSNAVWLSGEHAALEPAGSSVCTWRSTFHLIP